MNCSDSQIPPNKSLFNQHDSSLSRHVHDESRKSVGPILSENFPNTIFQLLLYIMKVKCQEDQQFSSLNFSDVT